MNLLPPREAHVSNLVQPVIELRSVRSGGRPGQSVAHDLERIRRRIAALGDFLGIRGLPAEQLAAEHLEAEIAAVIGRLERRAAA